MCLDFERLEKMGHEQVLMCHNPDVGLRAIIAIHNTALGPALGGTRMYPYKNEEEALTDVLRLSRGMTYKSAAVGLNYGGAKAVIIGDPKEKKSEGLFRAFGSFVNRLQGQFITGEDVGIDVNDIEFMYMETDYVAGLSRDHGGSGDPSSMTAYGVIQGIQACVDERLKGKHLKGLRVAVQGLGHVGWNLVELLHEQGAKVTACDLDDNLCEMARAKYGIDIVEVDKIYDVKCDIFSPCAMGGVINQKTLPRLQSKIIAGSANNQLESQAIGNILVQKNILYAPDYVINAGGLINVALEVEGYSESRAKLLTRNIYYNLGRSFEIAKDQRICPQLAADRLAEERISKLSCIKRSHFLDRARIRR